MPVFKALSGQTRALSSCPLRRAGAGERVALWEMLCWW